MLKPSYNTSIFTLLASIALLLSPGIAVSQEGPSTPRDTSSSDSLPAPADTARLTGPGGAGVQRVTWDLRGMPRPLGPSGIRDSVTAARVRRQREDSLRTAGGDTTGAGRNLPGMDTTAMRSMRDSMSAMRARGDTAGMRVFRERMQTQGRPGGPGARGRGQGGAGAGLQPGEINLRPAEAPAGVPPAFGGGGGGGRFGGGRTGPTVAEGDYLVTITAGGVTMTRVIHVERLGEIPEDPRFGGDNN